MKKININMKQSIEALFLLFLLVNCSKVELVDNEYPDSKVYMSQAAVVKHNSYSYYTLGGNKHNSPVNYEIENNRVLVPVGLIRSGVDLTGDITVNVSAGTDTVSTLISQNVFDSPTSVLPAEAYRIPASVQIKSGEYNSKFDLDINLDFFINSLINTPNQQYAVAIGIATGDNRVNNELATTVFVLNPSTLFMPVADCYSWVDKDTDGKPLAHFMNLSSNASAYTWNFGDGSATVSDISTRHRYDKGSYTVTLTAKSIDARIPDAVKTIPIDIK